MRLFETRRLLQLDVYGTNVTRFSYECTVGDSTVYLIEVYSSIEEAQRTVAYSERGAEGARIAPSGNQEGAAKRV